VFSFQITLARVCCCVGVNLFSTHGRTREHDASMGVLGLGLIDMRDWDWDEKESGKWEAATSHKGGGERLRALSGFYLPML